MQRILQRFLKKVKKPLVFEGSSDPLFGIFAVFALGCTEPQIVVRRCKSKGLQRLLFFTLQRRAILFRPVLQWILQ